MTIICCGKKDLESRHTFDFSQYSTPTLFYLTLPLLTSWPMNSPPESFFQFDDPWHGIPVLTIQLPSCSGAMQPCVYSSILNGVPAVKFQRPVFPCSSVCRMRFVFSILGTHTSKLIVPPINYGGTKTLFRSFQAQGQKLYPWTLVH